MKKLTIASAALILGIISSGFCAKNAEPETAPAMSFNGAENSVVLDTSTLKGKFSQNVRFISGLDGENSFVVRYFDAGKKDWIVFGGATTKSFADTAFINSRGHIGNRRWIAVTPEKAGSYKYEIAPVHNDLYIYVFPAKSPVDAATKAKAAIIDPSKYVGKFNDNVAIVNNTKTFNEAFTVYGFNDKDGDWSKIGSVRFEALKEERVVKTPYDKVSIFKGFAVVPASGKTYTYKTSTASHDLIITAQE